MTLFRPMKAVYCYYFPETRMLLHQVINDDVDQAVQEICNILNPSGD